VHAGRREADSNAADEPGKQPAIRDACRQHGHAVSLWVWGVSMRDRLLWTDSRLRRVVP
jgi:hypothetical protein